MVFDPTAVDALPAGTAALYLGGGFPEMHAADLAGNAALRADVADRIAGGLPTVAECAGLLYLCRSVDGAPMVGALDADAVMTPRLTLGYRDAVAGGDSVLAAAGTPVTGHEFHRTVVSPAAGAGSGTEVNGGVGAAWLIRGEGHGFALDPAGSGRATLHASFLHTHWAGHPALAARFAAAAHRFATGGRGLTRARTSSGGPRPGPAEGHGSTEPSAAGRRAGAGRGTGAAPGPDLLHHGDVDAAPGLLDFAVNVRGRRPPDWLAELIASALQTLGSYPNAAAATAAIATGTAGRSTRCWPPPAGRRRSP